MRLFEEYCYITTRWQKTAIISKRFEPTLFFYWIFGFYMLWCTKTCLQIIIWINLKINTVISIREKLEKLAKIRKISKNEQKLEKLAKISKN